VSQKACTPAAKLSSFSCANVPTKPFSRADENILKQRAAYVVVKKTGTASMQFFFDLIWNHEREAGQ